MNLLGIESSCDETAAAVVRDGREVLSSVVASQVATHREYGGVVPELASREHVDNICFVVERALLEGGVSWTGLDGVAVTRGPGLVGALLVGLTYAKAVAFARGIPFLGVNHLEGHIHSIFLDHPEAELPALSLVVSGGHTNLYHFRAVGDCELLAKTRDDAAGEALDKLSKHLRLGYPGGPVIERLAREGNARAVTFTLPKITDRSFDFSFSGLKTAALRFVRETRIEVPEPGAAGQTLPDGAIPDLAAGFQRAVIDQLIDRLSRAIPGREVRSIHVSGGVSCNNELRRRVTEFFGDRGLPVYYPRPALTTDNAAMIAAAGYRRLSAGQRDPWSLGADANLKVG